MEVESLRAFRVSEVGVVGLPLASDEIPRRAKISDAVRRATVWRQSARIDIWLLGVKDRNGMWQLEGGWAYCDLH